MTTVRFPIVVNTGLDPALQNIVKDQTLALNISANGSVTAQAIDGNTNIYISENVTQSYNQISVTNEALPANIVANGVASYDQAPSGNFKGQLYYNTTSNTLFVWNGLTWNNSSNLDASSIFYKDVNNITSTVQTGLLGLENTRVLRTGDIMSGPLTVQSNLTVTGITNLNDVANVKITGGINGQILATDGTGNLSWKSSGTATGNVINGVISIAPGSVSYDDTTQTLTYTGPNLTGLSVDGANVNGQVANANYALYSGTATTANTIAGANVTGTVANANYSAFANVAAIANTVAGANVTGTVANANYSAFSNVAAIANTVAGANVTGIVANANYALYANHVIDPTQPNITSVGTLTTLSVGGNLTVVTGTITGNGGGLSNVTGANVTGTVANANYALYSGTAATANTVAGANVTGTVANANYALYANHVIDPTQPNITSVGTLSSLAVTGNISVSLGIINGNGGGLSNVTGANVTGVVANANYAAFAGDVVNAAQPNITSVGTLSSLTVTNNLDVTTGVISGNGGGLSNVTGANVTGTVANANYALYSGVAYSIDGANVVGDVAGSGHANVADVANSIAGANVVGDVAGANFANFAGNVVAAAQPNITSVGKLTTLAVSGNVETDSSLIANTIISNINGITIAAGGAGGGADHDVVLMPYGNGSIAASSARIVDVSDPVNAQDVATKNYVDSVAQGLSIHSPVTAATGSPLAVITGGTVTYNNGTAGVGATLTLSVALTVLDGITLTSGDRVLVKNEAVSLGSNEAWNGIYNIDATGTILTRAIDSDDPVELGGGDFTFIEQGTALGGSGWVIIQPVVTVGTDPVIWEQFSAAGAYSAGVGLNLLGGTFSITNTTVVAATYGNATHLPIFTVNPRGQLTGVSTTAVIANAETLQGTTLKSTVVTSSLTSVGTLSQLGVTGNITAGNLTINGSGGVTASNITGTLTTNAQPNITSVGTLTSLTVTGNTTISTGNLTVTSGIITGNGGGLSNITGANVTGIVANANYSAFSNVAAIANTVAGANVTGTVANANYSAYAGNVTGAAQSNITSVGTLTSLTVTGNVDVTTGNLTLATGIVSADGGGLSNIVGANVTDIVANANYSAFSNVAAIANTVAGANVTGIVANANYSAFAGDVVNATQANITTVGTLTSLTVVGNLDVTTGMITADGGGLSNIVGANVTGIVANANYSAYAGNVTVAAQSNITSVGTLTSLTVTNNLDVTTGVISGDGGGLSNVTGANVTGIVANANYAAFAGDVLNAAQPNITSVGTLTSLTVSGDITVNGILNTRGTNEAVSVIAGATGVTNMNYANSSIFYLTGVVGNITANVQNYSTIANSAGAVSIVILQGGTAYSVTGIDINGVSTPINWQAGLPPSGNPLKTDVIALNIINNNGTYIALGQLVTFG